MTCHGGRRRGLALPGTGSLCLPPLLRLGRRASSVLYTTGISVVGRAEPTTHEQAKSHLSREATCCGEAQTYEQTEDVFGRVNLLDLPDTVTLFLLPPLLARRLSSILCMPNILLGQDQQNPEQARGRGSGREVTSRGRIVNKLAGRRAAAFFFLSMPQPDSLHLL